MKMNIKSWIICACSICFGLISCEETIQPNGIVGSIKGVVTESDGISPLGGAIISTNPLTFSATSDSLGQFTLLNLPVGEYNVLINKTDYITQSFRASIVPNDTVQIILSLEPSPTQGLPPLEPFSPLPVDGAEDLSISPRLSWKSEDPEKGEVLYTVMLFESDINGGTIVLESSADTTIQLDSLNYDTNYFWQVSATDEEGLTRLSPIWTFRTEPFPDHRILYVKENDQGFLSIYSTNPDEGLPIIVSDPNRNSWYPRFSPDRKKIAFVSYAGIEPHIFLMNRDGSQVEQLTDLPITGFHNPGVGFSWEPNGSHLIYGHYDRLLSINRDGSDTRIIAKAPEGFHFKACDWGENGALIVAEIVGSDPFSNKILSIDNPYSEPTLLIDDVAGTTSSPSLSITNIDFLFTQDVSGFQAPDGRQLNARITRYSFLNANLQDLSSGKPQGTNDLYPRYSPTGAEIIFVNELNDGSGPSDIYIMNVNGDNRRLLVSGATMPDWR